MARSKAKEKEQAIHVRLTRELKETIEAMAKENDLSVSIIVRLLLEKGLKSGKVSFASI